MKNIPITSYPHKRLISTSNGFASVMFTSESCVVLVIRSSIGLELFSLFGVSLYN